MNHNEAKVLLALRNLTPADREELALSGILTKSEVENALLNLENEGLITKSLTDQTFEQTQNGNLELEEYSKEFEIYRLHILEVYEQRPEHLNTFAHGSLLCFRLYDNEDNEISTFRMCLRSVITGQAFGQVDFTENLKSVDIFHWTAIKNFERFILSQIPDFQIIYSSNNHLQDFEVCFEEIIKNDVTIFLFGKLSPELIENFFRKKSEEFDLNEREGNKGKNKIGILTDADCIPYDILTR